MVGTAGGEADTEEALDRMREALALLDRAGHGVASCHLQMAIDVAAGARAAGAVRDGETQP